MTASLNLVKSGWLSFKTSIIRKKGIRMIPQIVSGLSRYSNTGIERPERAIITISSVPGMQQVLKYLVKE